MSLIEQKDYKKINRTRRSRGYSFEKQLVDTFNKTEGWTARRLGGASTFLPDLVITNNRKSILYSIECKSGESNILYIPLDQIERAKDITDNFLSIYQKRFIVFAFKFKATDKRKLQYRFLLITSPFIIPPTLKGASYNITTDKLIFHKTDDSPCFIPIPIQSIWGFVNFL